MACGGQRYIGIEQKNNVLSIENINAVEMAIMSRTTFDTMRTQKRMQPRRP